MEEILLNRLRELEEKLEFSMKYKGLEKTIPFEERNTLVREDFEYTVSEWLDNVKNDIDKIIN